jgi:ribosomal protein S18 acetylase RimI-like enzyme
VSTPLITVERLTAFAGPDLDDLCEATEAAIAEGGGFGWLKAPPRHILESYWKGILLVPGRHLFAARLDGVVAGSAQLTRMPRNNEAQAFAAHLTTCFVTPWARGHGLGRRLLEAVDAYAGAAGVEVINLDVRETQIAAMSLFEKTGYVRWGTHPAYARVEGRLVRGHFFYKTVAAAT